MKRVLGAVGFLWLSGLSAQAGCATDEHLFLRCDTARGKTLEVCMTDVFVRYTFGPKGGDPELTLRRQIGDGATYSPWPGIGSTIWESLRLRNADIVYEVYGGVEKRNTSRPESFDSRFGGVVVLQDGKGEIADLKCQAGSVVFAY